MKSLITGLRVLAPLLVLAVGGFAAFTLITTRPKAAKRPPSAAAPLVEVVAAERTDSAVSIEAFGTVSAAHVVPIVPEVSGRIVELAPALVQGGIVREGEVLVKIDPETYALRVDQLQAQVAKAQLDLRLELSRQKVAEREWAALESSVSEAPGEADRELALRNPQIRAARAAISAARSAVDAAKLDLARTTIRAPFDAYVREEGAEPGQLVGPGGKLATLVSTDAFWLELAVPMEHLGWIAIPGTNVPADAEGSAVTLLQQSGASTRVERQGRVLRLLPELEPTGRMARVLVTVADPLGLELPVEQRGLPLLVGAWVRGEIAGRTLEGAIAVPRQALRDGDKVWVVDGEGALRIRPVDVAWREAERVLVTAGIEPGERVVTSPLAAPVAGMALRVRGDEAAAALPVGGPVEPAAVAP
ncbi:MAG: efflux RND transporter periplasmic adaptor subunit [Deltaproteobacteria bacterium]|nr:efflux RND transporter periplasmic adaptor subunit [Deltaproteobacteria bacterium]